MYGLDTRALLLYKKGVDTMAGWARDLGYILTVVPTGKDRFELPFQNLAGIWGFMYYYDYTGDIDVIKHAYPMSREYILNYPMSENGLAAHKQGSWDWQDWGEYPDIMPMENAWYYMAVSGTERMARLLGHDDDARELSVRRDRIKAEYDRAYFKGESYYNKTENGRPDDRANALAVISGLASADKYEGIARVLCSTENSSPYMEKYVLDALCEMGYYREAVERMKRRYKEMVEYDYSTLWEYWNQDGTLNHAWSGGPLVTMSKYIAGIKPVETAYKRFSVKPNMCGLKHIRCVVPTVKGDIVVEADEIASENRYKMTVNVPMGTVADVYLPTQNGYKHYECGEGMNIIE